MDPKLRAILFDMVSEWKKFAYCTGINPVVIDYIDLDKGCNQVKMEIFFKELVTRNPSNYMDLVEKSLKEMGSNCILNEIKTFSAVDQLKQYYITTYGNHGEQYNALADIEIFESCFNLITVDDDFQNIKENNSAWEEFNKKINGCESVKFKDVFEQERPFIFISGLSGVGKTHCLKKCLLFWASGLIWKNIDFVFYCDLKRSNEFQNILGLNELTKKFYGNVLNGIEISSQWSITLIIDGLDETFSHFEKFIDNIFGSSSDISLVNTLENVVNSQEVNCIFAGRTPALATYINVSNKKALIVQIMGFNDLGMSCYIEKHLLSGELKKDLYNMASLSVEARAILSVPYYLNAICSVLMNFFIVSVKTVAELQTFIFYFIMQEKCLNNKPLYQVLETESLYIREICNLAFILLSNDNILVSKEQFNPILLNHGSQLIGFIELSRINHQYEFTHFIMMKFCASVHLYLCEHHQVAFSNNRLHICLPIICALNSGKDKNMSSLLLELNKSVVNETPWLHEVLRYNDRKLFIQCFYESQQSFNNDFKMPVDLVNKWNSNIILEEKADNIAEEYFKQETIKLHKIIDLQNRELTYGKIKRRVETIKKQINDAVKDAKSMYNESQFDNAKTMFSDVEELQKDILGEKDADTLTTKYWISRCLYNNQEFNNAKKKLKDLMKAQKEVFGENHVYTLNTLYWIARCLNDLKKTDKAEKTFIELENKQKNVLGEKHINTLNTKYWIGRCLYNKKQFEKAEDVLQEVEKIQKETLGEKNVDTINTTFWIAMCIYSKELFDIAEKIFIEVKIMQNGLFGANHENTLHTEYCIARCQYENENFDMAEELFMNVKDKQTEIFGEKHVHTLNTKFWCAMCLYDKKQYDSAKKKFIELELVQKEILGVEHEDTLNTKYWIAMCLRDLKDFENAQKLICEVDDARKEIMLLKVL